MVYINAALQLLVVAVPEKGNSMFTHILLAADGSEHGLRAAKVAGDLARAVDAEELRIIVAYDPVPAYLGEPNLTNAINARVLESDSLLKTALAEVGEVPSEVQTEMLEGSPAEAIIDVATTRNSSIIVMGSRGLGRLAGALLGSNAQKVVSHAPCPVLIVK
jgi:nucleotide-binding universal stress UspA family protein